MKNNTRSQQRQGFTLIEMVGVLAIIAILAAILIPRIFAAIKESEINSALSAYNSAKAAVVMHFGKYGKFNVDSTGADITAGGTPDLADLTDGTIPRAAANDYATEVLLPAGLLEKPFTTRIGSFASIKLTACLASTAAVAEDNGAYDFDEGAGNVNDAGGGNYVVEAVIEGVAPEDARNLSIRLDGASQSAADLDTADLEGKVKYEDPTGLTTVTVYMYLAHK